jgi:hypothetical protein
MATVGEQLLQPESGWKRIDSTSSNITYHGVWSTRDDSQYWNGQISGTAVIGDYATFNFTGTKLRIIGHLCVGGGTDISVFIDNMYKGKINQAFTTSVYQALNFEILDLENAEHTVKIVNNANGLGVDAIDIDENGDIKPPQGPPTLLRITMSDSSEREYRLMDSEVDSFVKWYDRTVNTGNTCYTFKDSVDSSKEYLAFEKIISFKVVPLS